MKLSATPLNPLVCYCASHIFLLAWGSGSAHFSYWLASLWITAFCPFRRSTSTHNLVPFGTAIAMGAFWDQKTFAFTHFVFLDWRCAAASPAIRFCKAHDKTGTDKAKWRAANSSPVRFAFAWYCWLCKLH